MYQQCPNTPGVYPSRMVSRACSRAVPSYGSVPRRVTPFFTENLFTAEERRTRCPPHGSHKPGKNNGTQGEEISSLR